MRFIWCTALLALLSNASSAGCATEGRAVTSEEEACEILKRAAVEFCLSRRNLAGRYYCDPLTEQALYYVVGLRYRTTPDELVGSNLVGWFAVQKSDGRVLEWDINEEASPAPLTDQCPFESE
jgi:hypothetical protein